jgi:hypothetical protein
MNLKQAFYRAIPKIIFILIDRSGGIEMPGGNTPGAPRLKRTETRIGGTTYIVNSAFNPKSGRTVLDKIARLIDKEIPLIPKN